MASTTTQTSICNRALQMLGYAAISSISENSKGAREMGRAYQSVLLEELRSNYWNFSILRAILAASATAPLFGPANYYPLPGDFLQLAPPDQYTNYSFGFSNTIPNQPNTNVVYNDYVIEQMPGNAGWAIASSQSGPLYIRYVSNSITEAQFDASFCEAFAAALAVACCEVLTNSTSKIQAVETIYKNVMDDAKKRNAYDSKPVKPPVDSWILVRM